MAQCFLGKNTKIYIAPMDNSIQTGWENRYNHAIESICASRINQEVRK